MNPRSARKGNGASAVSATGIGKRRKMEGGTRFFRRRVSVGRPVRAAPPRPRFRRPPPFQPPSPATDSGETPGTRTSFTAVSHRGISCRPRSRRETAPRPRPASVSSRGIVIPFFRRRRRKRNPLRSRKDETRGGVRPNRPLADGLGLLRFDFRQKKSSTASERPASRANGRRRSPMESSSASAWARNGSSVSGWALPSGRKTEPVEAGLVENASDWAFGSGSPGKGQEKTPPFATTDNGDGLYSVRHPGRERRVALADSR